MLPHIPFPSCSCFYNTWQKLVRQATTSISYSSKWLCFLVEFIESYLLACCLVNSTVCIEPHHQVLKISDRMVYHSPNSSQKYLWVEGGQYNLTLWTSFSSACLANNIACREPRHPVLKISDIMVWRSAKTLMQVAIRSTSSSVMFWRKQNNKIPSEIYENMCLLSTHQDSPHGRLLTCGHNSSADDVVGARVV